MSNENSSFDPVAIASTFTEEAYNRADEIESARRLPADLAKRLAEAGLFRMITPAYLGGYEVHPRAVTETLETLSIADASVGWCTMIAATTAINAAYLNEGTAKEVYGDPNVITGGVLAPMGKAEIDGEDYVVTGRWQWGSGTANCDWICGGCFVFENGERKLVEGTQIPETRMMYFQRKDVKLLDTWHVSGLKGTGSGDFSVEKVRIRRSSSVSLVTDKPRVHNPLYKFPPFGLLAIGTCAVMMGNARGALNAFIDLAGSKKNQGSRRVLAERQVVQAETAKAEASWRSARSYLYDELEKTWEVAKSEGRIPLETRADLRLACTNMTRTAADVCRRVYDLGGGAALFSNNELQRRFRDAHAGTQHATTAPATYELTGRVLFGLPTDGGMI